MTTDIADHYDDGYDDDLTEEGADDLAVLDRLTDLAPLLDGSHRPATPAWFRRDDGACAIYPGKLHVFAGEPEALKSWGAYIAASEAMNTGRTALWLDLEDGPETAVERLLALGVTVDAILDRFGYLALDSPLADDEIDGLVTVTEPALVIVDSFNELLALERLDPYSSVDVAAAHRRLRRFTRDDAAVVLLDHVVKDRDGRGRWAIGSERKLSGLDGAAFVFEVRQPAGVGRTGIARILVTKDRPGQVRRHAGGGRHYGDLLLASSAETGRITARIETPELADGGAAFRPTDAMAKLAGILAGYPAGASTRALRDAVDFHNRTVTKALDCLVEDGTVRREAGPRGAHIYHLAATYPPGENGASTGALTPRPVPTPGHRSIDDPNLSGAEGRAPVNEADNPYPVRGVAEPETSGAHRCPPVPGTGQASGAHRCRGLEGPARAPVDAEVSTARLNLTPDAPVCVDCDRPFAGPPGPGCGARRYHRGVNR